MQYQFQNIVLFFPIFSIFFNFENKFFFSILKKKFFLIFRKLFFFSNFSYLFIYFCMIIERFCFTLRTLSTPGAKSNEQLHNLLMESALVCCNPLMLSTILLPFISISSTKQSIVYSWSSLISFHLTLPFYCSWISFFGPIVLACYYWWLFCCLINTVRLYDESCD